MRIMRTRGGDNTEMLTRQPDKQPVTDAVIGVPGRLGVKMSPIDSLYSQVHTADPKGTMT